MNIPVNFELAKLLKEKGFNEPCDSWYYNDGGYHDNPTKWVNSDLYETIYSRPTISDVVMWLYEKHGIWLWVNRWYQQDENVNYWSYYIDGEETVCYCESPTEAYEKAIEHVLKNLL